MLSSFDRFNLIFNKMGLIFLKVLIIFTVSSFEFLKSDCLDFIANDEWHQKKQVSSFLSQIALTSSLMMSGTNSPNLNPLDYQVWGKCWSLYKSCNRSQSQFPSFKMHFS